MLHSTQRHPPHFAIRSAASQTTTNHEPCRRRCDATPIASSTQRHSSNPAPQVVAVPAEPTTSKRRRLAMNINRINDAIRKAMKNAPTPDGSVFVCKATEEEWNAFVDCEDPEPALKPNLLEWFEASGEIHIVEFADVPHESLIVALNNAFIANADVRYLACRGGAKNSSGRKFLPDASYGPTRNTPHAVLPHPNMNWRDFNTIKVEIGVTQRWGDRPGQLDYKATTTWAALPGVEYVLCIKTNDDYSVAEYKLYDCPGGGRLPAVLPHATPIVRGTTVTFDAHRMLGIPHADPLPTNQQGQPFEDPFPVNLHAALEMARAWL